MIKGRQTVQFQDFFTPPAAAKELAEHLRSWLSERAPGPIRVLEPSVGSGNLLWPLIEAARDVGCDLEITAIDVQGDYLEHVAAEAKKLGVEVVIVSSPAPTPTQETLF
jgi:methylase of polypeptide subunit release factors